MYDLSTGQSCQSLLAPAPARPSRSSAAQESPSGPPTSWNWSWWLLPRSKELGRLTRRLPCTPSGVGRAAQVAAHDAPIRSCRFIPQAGGAGILATGGWDKCIKVSLSRSRLRPSRSARGVREADRSPSARAPVLGPANACVSPSLLTPLGHHLADAANLPSSPAPSQPRHDRPAAGQGLLDGRRPPAHGRRVRQPQPPDL